MIKSLGLLAILVLILSCNKKKIFDGPNTYQDGFETYTSEEDLIDGENVLWSFFQLTDDENSISIDTTISHTGNASVRFFAKKSTNDLVSKCSINKQFMAFWEKETVVVEFWCYLADTNACDWLFLFDLEEKVTIGAGPGMRLAIVDDKIALEHKYPNPNVFQEGAGIEFPRNEWVKIKFEALLSRKKKGTVKVWQNDQLILSKENWKTLPKDLVYAQQGTKGMYNQIEFGITANSKEADHLMYVDDINVYTLQ